MLESTVQDGCQCTDLTDLKIVPCVFSGLRYWESGKSYQRGYWGHDVVESC